MNYADDPEWAHKQWYSPEQRAAYEMRVQMDRQQRDNLHRDAQIVGLALGAFAVADIMATAPQRRRARAGKQYHRDNPMPDNFQQHLSDLMQEAAHLKVNSRRMKALLAEYSAILEKAVDLKQLG